MPADLAARLLEQWMEAREPKESEAVAGSGGMKTKYSDLSELAASLKGWSGMKVG